MKFQPGNTGFGGGKKGRSGRPPRIREEELTKALSREFPADKVALVIRRLVDLATGEEVNIAATQLLLAYAFGKPVETRRHLGDAEQPVVYRLKWTDGNTGT